VSKVQPIMVVYFEGQIHRIPVKQGDDGLAEFTAKIRELFRLPEDVDISLTFGCKEPMSGQHLKLEGTGAFDAAVHCASVAAAERQHKVKKSYSTGNLNANGAVTGGLGHHTPVGRSTSSSHLGSSAAADHSTQQQHNSSNSLASGPAATADGDRRRRFQAGGHRQHANTFHVRGGSGAQRPASASAAAPSLPPATARLPPPGPRAPGGNAGPEPFRNILSLVSGGGAGAGHAADGAAAASEAAQDHLRPEQSSRSMSALPSGRERLKGGRYSSRNITELTDVPEMDETVAVGSLSGKFKLHLKAFSRKVARSLSFTNKGNSSGASSSRSNGMTSRTPSVTAGTPGMPPLPPRPGQHFTIPTGSAGAAPGAGEGMGPLTAAAPALRPPVPVPASG
jgi:hypothetical protein